MKAHTMPVYYTEVRGEMQFFATEAQMVADLREWVESYYAEDYQEVLGVSDDEFMEWIGEIGYQFDKVSYGWGDMALPAGWKLVTE